MAATLVTYSDTYEAEDRTVTVEAEDRTVRIPAEDRIVT